MSSIRLEGLRDGAEDWSLFSMLGVSPDGLTSRAADLLTQLVTAGTPSDVDASKSEIYTDDWALLERLRRQAAHRVVSRRIKIDDSHASRHLVHFADSMTNVMRGLNPPTPTTKTRHIALAANEFEGIQLVVRTNAFGRPFRIYCCIYLCVK